MENQAVGSKDNLLLRHKDNARWDRIAKARMTASLLAVLAAALSFLRALLDFVRSE